MLSVIKINKYYLFLIGSVVSVEWHLCLLITVNLLHIIRIKKDAGCIRLLASLL